MNVKGTDTAGGGTGGYWNKKIGDVVEELPEAEVEVISPGADSDDSGWFYQEPTTSDSEWFTQENNYGSGETAYNEIYYTAPENTEYDNTPYSSGSTSQKAEQPVLQNVVEQSNPQPESQTTAEQEAAAYINAVLGQQANNRPGPVASQKNNSFVAPLFDEEAIRRSIQQSIEQANAEANANAQHGNAQNAQNMQNVLDWDWRNETAAPTAQTETQAKGGNMVLPPNYRATDSNSGTSMEQVFTPVQQQSPTLLDRIVSFGVPAAYAEDVPEELPEISAPLDFRTQGISQIPISSVSEAASTDIQNAIEEYNRLSGENPYQAGPTQEELNSMRQNAAEGQQPGSSSPSLVSRIFTAIGNGAHEIAGDYDQSIQDAAGQIGSFIINNSGADPESAKMNTIEEMMFADGINPDNVIPFTPLWDEYEDKFDEMYPDGIEVPVSEITPEYFTEKANRKINEFGTGLENTISSAFESFADESARLNEADIAAARLGIEPGSPEYYAFIDNYVLKSTPQNTSDLAPENQRAEQLRTRQLENAIQENANVDMSAQTKRDYGSGTYGVPGYNYDGSMNPTLQSVLAGERTINQPPDGRPGYNADGTPNDMLKALLNGEFISDATIGELAATYPEHYETLRRSNADGMLALFDATYGQSGAGFEGITIPSEIAQFIASNTGKALGQLELGYLDGNGNLSILRNEDIEYIKASGEDYDRAIDTLIGANKVLQDMISAGLVTRDDIARHFFKGLSETKEDEDESTRKSYGGGGGGYKKSSSGSSRRGGYGGSSGGSNYGYAPSDKEQKQARVNNIMKNWTF